MNFTRWLIVFIVTTIGLVDLLLAIHGGMQATISWQMTTWSHEYPVIPFAIGFLMGHFFAQDKL